MKKILVPTDFSECSLNAVEFAAHIARKNAAEIHLLHVVSESPTFVAGQDMSGAFNTSYENIWAHLMKIAQKNMKELKGKEFMQDVKVKEYINTGSVLDEITHCAKEIDADMIVMGTHGDNGLHELFLGSNAEKVARTTDRPLLTIKHKVENPDMRNIVFASDFSGEAEIIFPTVKKIADIFKATIHLVKVNTIAGFETTRESVRKIREFLNYVQEKFPYTVYNDRLKEEGIIHYANEVKADLIVLGTHGRGGLFRFFSPSIAEGLVNHSPRPVLTVNIMRVKKIEEEKEPEHKEEYVA